MLKEKMSHQSFDNRHDTPLPKGGVWKVLQFYAYFKISGSTANVESVPSLGKYFEVAVSLVCY